ncbi:hypothetical protein [Spirosoma utsteinense]|nr:hypothetical protein [Spirosoma utsteinense]
MKKASLPYKKPFRFRLAPSQVALLILSGGTFLFWTLVVYACKAFGLLA